MTDWTPIIQGPVQGLKASRAVLDDAGFETEILRPPGETGKG